MYESQLADQVPRFRTIKDCLIAIKEVDPQTAVTEWYIRLLCKSNTIICYKSGNKSLVNLDNLLDYLNRGLDDTNQDKNISYMGGNKPLC